MCYKFGIKLLGNWIFMFLICEIFDNLTKITDVMPKRACFLVFHKISACAFVLFFINAVGGTPITFLNAFENA